MKLNNETGEIIKQTLRVSEIHLFQPHNILLTTNSDIHY